MPTMPGLEAQYDLVDSVGSSCGSSFPWCLPSMPANHHVQRGSGWDLWPPQYGWKLTTGQEGGCEGHLRKLMPRTALYPSWAAAFSRHLSENG